MGRPLAIPRLLGISWWWVFGVCFVEGFLRYRFPVPEWLPSIFEFWLIAQAAWLLAAEPRSRALYIYIAWGTGLALVDVGPVSRHLSDPARDIFPLLLAVLGLIGFFVFRSEMEQHFTETDPRGIELGRVMTFFWNGLYFQYWFHQIYVEQNEPDLRLAE